MFRHRDQRFDADNLVLGQPPVTVDDICLGHRVERSTEPVREEGIDHPISGFEPGDTRADRDHVAGGIREWHTTGRDRRRVPAIEDDLVTEVERTRPHVDEHLACTRRWDVSLDKDEAIQTSEPIKLVRAHFWATGGHVRSSSVSMANT